MGQQDRKLYVQQRDEISAFSGGGEEPKNQKSSLIIFIKVNLYSPMSNTVIRWGLFKNNQMQRKRAMMLDSTILGTMHPFGATLT